MFLWLCLCVCVWVRACLAFSLRFKSVWSFLKVLERGYFLLLFFFFLRSPPSPQRRMGAFSTWLTADLLVQASVEKRLCSQSVCVGSCLWKSADKQTLSISLVLVIFPFIPCSELRDTFFQNFFPLCQTALFWNPSCYYSHISAIYSAFNCRSHVFNIK